MSAEVLQEWRNGGKYSKSQAAQECMLQMKAMAADGSCGHVNDARK